MKRMKNSMMKKSLGGRLALCVAFGISLLLVSPSVRECAAQFKERPLQQAARKTFGRLRDFGSESSRSESSRPESTPRFVPAPTVSATAQSLDASASAVEPQEPTLQNSETPQTENASQNSETTQAENASQDSDAPQTENASQNSETTQAENASQNSETPQTENALQNSETTQTPEQPAEEAGNLASESEDAPDARVNLPQVDPSDVANAAENAGNSQTSGLGRPVIKSSRSLGFDAAPRALKEMTNDLKETLGARGGMALYERWRAYNAGVRRQTTALESGSELNGRCRLRWYDALYQDPLNTLAETEYFSRAWGDFFFGKSADVVSGVRLARDKMDVATRGDRSAVKAPKSPSEALQALRSGLVEAASLHAKALAPMSADDVAAVSKEAHSIFCGQVQTGHTIPSRGRAKYLIDAMQKENKSALYDSAETLLALLDETTLEQLAKIDFASLEKVRVDDQEVGRIATEAGDILIGGTGRNVWNLDKYSKVCCVVDLGGDDVYNEGSCNVGRPLLFVVDLGDGADEYVGKNPGIQGGSILGVSIWFDEGGDDKYLAKDVAQGSAIGGVGVLINNGGNDRYLGFLRAQGTALCGLGLLVDRGGNDDYRGALFAQGFGAPGGFGALADKDGDDHYFVGGYYYDSYPEHPGYDGWGQGVGAGIRRVACGGIGLLLDGGGDDAYEYDYFAHGGGYWMGVGIARDFDGNDIRYAATSTMYDGSQRREGRWQRFSSGFGCHYAVGYLFDDQGNDAYNGTIMGLGMGWDLGAGFLVDFGGDDVFEATGGLTQGAGGEGSVGVLMNYRGNDIYRGSYQGYASGRLTYHTPQNCGANYSFVIDHGGNDQYGCRAGNNAVTPRGGSTGFVVDRPAPDESAAGAAATGSNPPSTTQGYPTSVGAIRTMAAPASSVAPPAPNYQQSAPQGMGRGWRIFGGGM